jgi:hypothetical protein
MAKSTKAQEVSTGTSDSYTEDEVAGMSATLRGRPMLGGELLSAGINSSRSSGKEKTSGDSENPSHQAPAQTTENPSSATEPVADSDADSTGGVGLREAEQQSVSPATPAQKKRARSATVDISEFE